MESTIQITPGEAEAPRNQWYVIAFGYEIGRAPLQRRILGDPIVLYRTESGGPVALFDRCPHRGMRLSNGGKLVDDGIQCPYHGLEFGADGVCRKVPSGGPISQQLRVASYPLVEVWDWVWIWPGDPALANPALIPDHHSLGLTDPNFSAYSGMMLEIEANYLMALENFVDATHVAYLHHGFIGSTDVAEHPFRTEVDGLTVSTIRDFEDEAVFPYAKLSYGLRSDVADRELKLSSCAPSVTIVSETYREKLVENPRTIIARIVSPMTPSTKTSCYQFVAVVRTLPTSTEGLFDGLRTLFMEDVVALADIQRLFNSLSPEQQVETSVRSDNPGLRTRRIIETMIRDERRTETLAA